jgi:hypothetical protein
MAENNINFAEWVEQYAHEQSVQNKNINQLTKDVAELAATVRQLVDNQKGLYSRQNRPINWGAILTAIGMAAAFVALLVAPMKAEDVRQHNFDLKAMEHMVDSAALMAGQEKDIEWLMKMEDRLNRRLHRD